MAYEVKRNDLEPIHPTLIDKTTGGAVDLTDVAEVWMHMRQLKGTKVVHIECVVDDEAQAMLTVNWADGDTDTAGMYQVEFEAIWKSGATVTKRRTIPNSGYKELLVWEDLGEAT